MIALIASHDAVVAQKLQTVLQREGHDCPASHLAPIQRVVPLFLQASPRPELVILVWDAGDDQFESLKQIAETGQVTIVVIAPAKDPHQILRAIHAGADDYLDLHEDFASELSAMLARLEAKSGTTPVSGRLFTFTAPGGGTGVSTIALNVAALLAAEQQRCALLECNPQCGALATMLSLTVRHTMHDLADRLNRLELDVLRQAMIEHSSGIHLLPGAVSPIGNEFDPNVCIGVADVARRGFPLVVVDAGRTFYEAGIEHLWRRSDVLALVVRLDLVTLREARQAIDHFHHLGLGPERVRVVANRYGQPGHLPLRKAEKALGMRVSHLVADDPRNVNFSVNCGAPVVVEAPRARVAKDLRKTARSLLTTEAVIPSDTHLEVSTEVPPSPAAAATHKVLWPLGSG